MGENSPISAKNIDPEQFELFKSDLVTLLRVVTQDEMGKRMGINKSNVSKYVRGNLPVTRGFLQKFYAVWGTHIGIGSSRIDAEDRPAMPTLRDIMAILQRIEKKIDAQIRQPPEEN